MFAVLIDIRAREVYTLINRARLNLDSLNETYSERAVRDVYDAEQTAQRGKAMKMDREKEIVKISMIGIFLTRCSIRKQRTIPWYLWSL